MALAAGVTVGRAALRLRRAAFGLSLASAASLLALVGCSESVNNSLLDKLAAGPSVPMPARATEIVPKASDMAGRWVLTMPGTGSCDMTFGAAAAQGTIAPEDHCPGKFLTSRRWDIGPGGVVIRDQGGTALAQLRIAEPGRLEGQTTDGEQVLMAR
jgi:Protease inhibitor Inh